jgi:DNA-packaging protein gp3
MAKKKGNKFINLLFGSDEEEKEQPSARDKFPNRFKAGNKFWEVRSKHGRDLIFSTPEIMYEAACEYFTWCEENPIIETDFRGKDLQEVCLPKVRAFTWHGLTHHLHVSLTFFNQFEADLKAADKEKQDRVRADDFYQVIEEIRGIIYRQKFEGAAAGQLNANLISRELGLADKKEVKSDNRNVEKIEIEIVEAKDPDEEK